MGVGGQRHAPATLPPGKRPGTCCTWGWMPPPPQGRYGGEQRISPSPGLDPRTVQPVAKRYTDYAIPAYQINLFPV